MRAGAFLCPLINFGRQKLCEREEAAPRVHLKIDGTRQHELPAALQEKLHARPLPVNERLTLRRPSAATVERALMMT